MFPSPKIQMALTFPSLSLTGVFNLLCRLQNTECRCIGFLAEGWVVTASDKLEMTPNWPSVIHTLYKSSQTNLRKPIQTVTLHQIVSKERKCSLIRIQQQYPTREAFFSAILYPEELSCIFAVSLLLLCEEIYCCFEDFLT